MSCTIFRHVHPDVDAYSSTWAVIRYAPGAENAIICDKPAEWDGSGMKDCDYAVDIKAGGRGIKGELRDNRRMSAFASVMEKYAPTEVLEAMAPFISWLEIQDSKGHVIDYLAPGISKEANQKLYFTSIQMVLLAVKTELHDSIRVQKYMNVYFDGMLKIARSQLRDMRDFDALIKEGKRIKILHDGKVAINFIGKKSFSQILFEQGVFVVIYVSGNNLGLVRESCPNGTKVRMDHDDIRSVVRQAGEDADNPNDWYSHSSGFLYCHGSEKNPATTPSKVDPYKLAAAVASLL